MKLLVTAVAMATVLIAGQAAAQSFRPLPGAADPLPLGDDNSVFVTLPFAIKMGVEAPSAAFILSQNAQMFSPASNGITPYFDDLHARVDTGQAYYGESIVDGRPAFIATFADVGYCCGGVERANVQLVVIDRSDIAPGDFDFEVNTEGLGRASHASEFWVDGVNVGRAGVSVFPMGPDAYRATWTFRDGVLTSGVGPTLMAPPQPVVVPTMTEWAMILFGLLLAGGAAVHLTRRREAA